MTLPQPAYRATREPPTYRQNERTDEGFVPKQGEGGPALGGVLFCRGSQREFSFTQWFTYSTGEKIGSTGRTYSIQGVYSIAMLCSGSASSPSPVLLGFLFGIPQTNSVVEWSRNEVGTARTRRSDAGDNAEFAAGRGADRVGDRGRRPARRGPRFGITAKCQSGKHFRCPDQGHSRYRRVTIVQSTATGSTISAPKRSVTASGPEPSGRIVALCVISYGAVEGISVRLPRDLDHTPRHQSFARDDPQS